MITYLPMAQGFAYLVAILDLNSRKVLSFRVSNAMSTEFCVEALQEALTRYGAPEIFNTDQGAQFTAEDFTQVLQAKGVRVSMDGCGRWRVHIAVRSPGAAAGDPRRASDAALRAGALRLSGLADCLFSKGRCDLVPLQSAPGGCVTD